MWEAAVRHRRRICGVSAASRTRAGAASVLEDLGNRGRRPRVVLPTSSLGTHADLAHVDSSFGTRWMCLVCESSKCPRQGTVQSVSQDGQGRGHLGAQPAAPSRGAQCHGGAVHALGGAPAGRSPLCVSVLPANVEGGRPARCGLGTVWVRGPGVKEGGDIAHSTYSGRPFARPRVNVP